jgi:uncharacterized protein (UPF0335 family)
MSDGFGTMGGNAQAKLRSLVERIERLNSEKADLMDDIKSVFTEAKLDGFDVRIIRKVVAQRAKDRAKVDEEAALIELYLSVVGLGEL